MAATRIKLSELERMILDRVFLSPEGFEPVEDLMAATGAERNQFVDALETLEGHGYLQISSLGESIVVGPYDLLSELSQRGGASLAVSHRVGHC